MNKTYKNQASSSKIRNKNGDGLKQIQEVIEVVIDVRNFIDRMLSKL